MVDNDNEYKVTTGDYGNKAGDLKFGYEYTTGNKINSNEKPKRKLPPKKDK